MFAFYSSILVFSFEIELFDSFLFFPVASPGVSTLSPVGIWKGADLPQPS